MSGPLTCPNCGHENSADRALCIHCSGALAPPQQTEPGRYLGRMISQRYRVVERLARGGMGEVYVAEHAETRQLVAVKFLHKRYAGDASFAARFFNEARYASQVTHPNAVATYDFGRLEDGTLFLVMEYVRGQSLRRVVRAQGIIPVHMAVRISSQVAEVLASAHEKKIIHRDVKPDNIMLVQGAGGRVSVKVLDFGIAKILDDETGHHTEPGVMFGTPEYMSPEQALGREYDHRVDIYALGLVLYYMLAGHPPFQSKNKMAVLQQQAKALPEPIQRVSKQPLPKGLIELIDTMLSKLPDERPATMVEVLERLDDVLADPALDADILSMDSVPLPALTVTDGAAKKRAEQAQHVRPPAASPRVRQGEAYAPIAKNTPDPSLAPVRSDEEAAYHFTQTVTRIPPLSMGKGSKLSAVVERTQERPLVIAALIAFCTMIVVLAVIWLLPSSEDPDVSTELALEQDEDRIPPTSEETSPDADREVDSARADRAPNTQKTDRVEEQGDKTAPPSSAANATRHAEQMTQARTALKNGDLGAMRSALAAIPTTDPPAGFKELRAQLLRAEKLTADVRAALDQKHCAQATTAANALQSEFDEKLASPYRSRIEACEAAVAKAEPNKPASPPAEKPVPSATPPTQAPAASKPAASDPPAASKPADKPASSASESAKPQPSKSDGNARDEAPSKAPTYLPPDTPASPPVREEKPAPKPDPKPEPTSDAPDDVLPPMEL